MVKSVKRSQIPLTKNNFASMKTIEYEQYAQNLPIFNNGE